MQNRQPGRTPRPQAMRQPRPQQTAQPRQMPRPSGRPQQTGRSAASGGNRPNGILGNLLNMQDPIGSLNKIVSIFKLLG